MEGFFSLIAVGKMFDCFPLTDWIDGSSSHLPSTVWKVPGPFLALLHLYPACQVSFSKSSRVLWLMDMKLTRSAPVLVHRCPGK